MILEVIFQALITPGRSSFIFLGQKGTDFPALLPSSSSSRLPDRRNHARRQQQRQRRQRQLKLEEDSKLDN